VDYVLSFIKLEWSNSILYHNSQFHLGVRMVKRIITLSFIIISLLTAQGRSLPALIYGPTTSSYIMEGDSIIVMELKIGKKLADDLYLYTGKDKTFLLICEETLLELQSESKIVINKTKSSLRIIQGNVIIHKEEDLDSFCYNVVVENGAIGYVGLERLRLSINYRDTVLHDGTFFPKTDYILVNQDFIKETRRDGKYIFSLIYHSDLPTLQKGFYLPSKRDKKFKFSTREKTGTATYKSNSYFHAGTNLRLRMNEMEFVYNIWIALSSTKGFYTNNWDEWQDIINNIHHLQIFHPSDPFFLRIGMIDKLEFGRGYLVDNYNNTIILPFENLSGLQIKTGTRNFTANFFLNDLTRPRIGGLYFNKRISNRFNASFTYVGDINQHSNIHKTYQDKDGDSYPDIVDPQDNIENYPNETVIVDDDTTYTNDLISLDNIDDIQLHAFGLGLKYQIANISGSDVFITGDLGILSTPSLGISFPNLFIGNNIFEFGVGADFQSPSFQISIFDRSYEYNKARFIKNEEGKYALISRDKLIENENEWYTGWNTYFNLYIVKRLSLSTKYRNVNRGNDYSKHVTISVNSRYSFSEKLRNYSFFLDHKDFDKIFKE